MSDTFGPTSATPSQPFARWSPSLKTWTATGLWDLPMSLPTLPAWGCLQGGELFEQPTPERPTVASESSSSLPTPTARDSKDHMIRREPHRPEATDTLSRALTDLLPTPTVMDMGSNYTPEEWEVWKAQQRAAHRNGNGHGASLTQEAISLLGTPRSQMGSMSSKPKARLETDIGQLQEALSLLPTPRAQNGEDRNQNIWARPLDQPQNLENALALLPTPTATDVGKHAGQPRHKRIGHQARIADVIEYLPQWNGVDPLLGTPCASPGIRSKRFRTVGQNPAEFALGVDTAQPSADGSRSAADPRQIQLFPAPTADHA